MFAIRFCLQAFSAPCFVDPVTDQQMTCDMSQPSLAKPQILLEFQASPAGFRYICVQYTYLYIDIYMYMFMYVYNVHTYNIYIIDIGNPAKKRRLSLASAIKDTILGPCRVRGIISDPGDHPQRNAHHTQPDTPAENDESNWAMARMARMASTPIHNWTP